MSIKNNDLSAVRIDALRSNEVFCSFSNSNLFLFCVSIGATEKI